MDNENAQIIFNKMNETLPFIKEMDFISEFVLKHYNIGDNNLHDIIYEAQCCFEEIWDAAFKSNKGHILGFD
jgi:hypothetical protein